MAVLLAGLGVWTFSAYRVSRQTREIGIRLALGMPRALARRSVVLSALRSAAFGASIGVALTLMGGRLVDTRVFGVAHVDVQTLITVVGFLVLLTVAAVIRPAWRASAVDPMDAMRNF